MKVVKNKNVPIKTMAKGSSFENTYMLLCFIVCLIKKFLVNLPVVGFLAWKE